MPREFTLAYWLLRASDARSLAEDMSDPEAKRMMLTVAAGYERLARHHASQQEIGIPMDGPADTRDND